MDRRNFMKVFLSSSLIPPLLTASSRLTSSSLYIISDSPEKRAAALLSACGIPPSTFTVSEDHPRAWHLSRSLLAHAHSAAIAPGHPELSFAFHPLSNPTLASFSFVKGEIVRDIRFSQLRSMWEDMRTREPASSLLTIASYKTRTPNLLGDAAAVYKEGKKIAQLPLNKDRLMSLAGKTGKTVIEVKKGNIRVSQSSCKHKICCYTPPASLAGERIICAPNQLLVKVQGRSMIDTSIG